MCLEGSHQIPLNSVLRVQPQVLQHFLRMLHRIAAQQIAHQLRIARLRLPARQIALREHLVAHIARLTHRAARSGHVLRSNHRVLQHRFFARLDFRVVHQILKLTHKSLLIAREVRHFLTIRSPSKLHIAVLRERHFVVLERLFGVAKQRVHLRIHGVFRVHRIDALFLRQRIHRSIEALFRLLRLSLLKQRAAQRSVLLFPALHLLSHRSLFLLLLLRFLHFRSDHSDLPAVQTGRFLRRQSAQAVKQKHVATQRSAGCRTQRRWNMIEMSDLLGLLLR